MAKGGKKYREKAQLVDRAKKYSFSDAFELVKQVATARFDESVDIAVKLGVNPRHADQMVRGAVSLPFGTGKSVRVLVFAQGEAARAAQEAGADYVGADEIVQKIMSEGWLEFDKVVATRDMMGKVGRLGRVLGPRGLMPNPKVGTVVAPEQVADTVGELKRGKIDFRVEKAGIVHASIGKVSMEAEQLAANAGTLMAALLRMKPSTAKGTYVRSVAVSSTMGLGIRVDTLDAQRFAESL
ncbi:MAG TPA: 50S ribosomal protein L1 [Deltaproteobacteria bacterium]|nr:50S ribosomal protein L1 [Deltaproteobacteria bacterium]